MTRNCFVTYASAHASCYIVRAQRVLACISARTHNACNEKRSRAGYRQSCARATDYTAKYPRVGPILSSVLSFMLPRSQPARFILEISCSSASFRLLLDGCVVITASALPPPPPLAAAKSSHTSGER